MTAKKLEPFAQHEPAQLRSLGEDALWLLLEVMHKRAAADGETLVRACVRLPEAWRATMLMVFVLERLDARATMKDLLASLEEQRDFVIAAFDEIGEREIAALLRSQAATAVDVLAADVRKRARKKIGVLIGRMGEPLPSAASARSNEADETADDDNDNNDDDDNDDESCEAPPQRDPSTAVLPEELMEWGDAAVSTLLHIVEQRALARDRSFGDEARTLPREWRNVVLASDAVRALVEEGSFSAALRHVRSAAQLRELRTFFVENGLEPFASAFDEAQLFAAELFEEKADAETIAELDALLHPDAIDAADVQRTLLQAAAMVSEPFPPVDED